MKSDNEKCNFGSRDHILFISIAIVCPLRISLGTEGDVNTGILDILKARRDLGITDAKNMVYAHLGMSEAEARSHSPINYSKSKAQVYEEIARHIYKNSYDFSILALVENVDLQTRPGLPAW
ncbi:hypothetical protein DL95DRAFT_469893 [Leptodontidium sp. 2 PMI_412]|nr:hypothetical protein DL95DRAFT_469893 [Leptodontidium sp. 2 PMI_412]